MTLTLIPPAFAYAEVLPFGGLGYHAVLLVALRDGVVGVAGAFFDELLAGAVGNIGLCDRGGSLVDLGGKFDGSRDGFGFGGGLLG